VKGNDHLDPLKLVMGHTLLRELFLLTNNVYKTPLVICPHFMLVSESFICSSVHWRENEYNVISHSAMLYVPSCLVQWVDIHPDGTWEAILAIYSYCG